MELKFEKTMNCRLAAHGKWGNGAAAWMGLSFFLRMVYYFAWVNLNDLSGLEIAFSVVLPLIISVAFILVLKVDQLALPVAAAGLGVAFAVNYFFNQPMGLGGVLSGILLLATAGLILAAVLGYIPERKWLLWGGMATLGFRALFVDLIGALLPLNELDIIAYIPLASNLFGIAAIANLCAALRLKKAE